MRSRLLPLAPLLLLALLLPGAAHGQATSDGPTGRTGAGAALGFAAVRPLADPSQACRHGADGRPGVPVRGEEAQSCPTGGGQPSQAGQPPDPPPFTGGVFGPGGRGPDKRPLS